MRPLTVLLRHGRWAAEALGAAAGLLVMGSGCSVEMQELHSGPLTKNECDEDRECGTGKCVGGECRAETGTIESLLLEVTPPAETSSIAGVRFVHALTGLDPAGGALTVELGHVSRIEGSVHASTDALSCLADVGGEIGGDLPAPDGSVPARITLFPRQRHLGISSPSQTSDAVLVDGGHRFTTAVPPGQYDIYVEPKGLGACAQPPHLFLSQSVEAGDVGLSLKLIEPQRLGIVVRWPHPEPELNAWSLDIVDAETGRLLSTQAVLADPVAIDGGLEYRATVAYVPPQPVNAAGGAQLVRLSPPAQVTAPQMIIDRSVVELFHEGEGVIDQLRSLPRPVHVVGYVGVANDTLTVPATVSLLATELRMISPGTVAAFERVVDTDDSGQFAVDLLPGTYRVIAVPPVGSGLSPTQVIWQISANQEVQAGRLVELMRSSVITAQVLGPGRGVVAGAAVQAEAQAGVFAAEPLDRVLGRSSYTPRAQSTVTDGDGRFGMQADRGIFDLSVRPGSSTGFPWLLLPGVDATGPEVRLGDLQMPLPVEFSGVVTSADIGTGVTAALVRAYVYLKDTELTNDPGEATAAVPIAEGRAGADGSFRILVPAALSSY